MQYAVLVDVSLRSGIADPAGSTIERALPALGYEGVSSVRVGKTVRFDIEADTEDAAREAAQAICETFLTNPVIEDATVTLEGGS